MCRCYRCTTCVLTTGVLTHDHPVATGISNMQNDIQYAQELRTMLLILCVLHLYTVLATSY